jgi:zinc protease
VFSYYQLAYEPGNMIFIVVGDLDPEEMLKTVRKYVSDFKPRRVFSHDIAAEPPVLGPRTLVATFPKLGQARLELGFEGVKVTSEDMYPLDLLAEILGGGDSAMLVEQLRDQKQLVSEISANDDTPAYAAGTFTVDMQLDPDKVDAATSQTLDVLESLKSKLVTPERIRRAKTQLKVAHVKSEQTVEDISTELADDYMSTGDLHFSDKYVDRIEAVTAEQMELAARKYFHKSRLLTTLMLPSEYTGATGLPKAEDLIRPASAAAAQPTTAPIAGDVRKVQLENGVTLLLKRIGTSPLVNINMYSLGGVTAEDAKNNGIGNLAMQMLPRGTATRSAEQIAEFFDSIGGSIDTACGTNSWYWTSACLKSDLDKTLDVYGDIVNHPAFSETELAAMKQRVDAQISSEDADWTAQSMRFFKQEFFGPIHSPYQFLPEGTGENVDKFTAGQLKDWYARKVLGGKRVIAIYGDIDLDHTEAIVRKTLGSGPGRIPIILPEIASLPTPAPAASPSVDVQDVKIQKTEQALAGVVIGFKSNSIQGDPANYILDVGQTMAGGWGYPTGYLFETLRGRGLVYVVQAENTPGRSQAIPGDFVVFAGCDPSKVNEVVDQILLNIARLQGTNADMQEDWFTRSKLLITTADAMDNETPQSQASAAALDELFGLGYDFHAKFASSINAVTLDQIRATAAARLHNCVVTISTPNPDAVNIKTGVRSYASFPTVDLTPRGVQHATGVVKP